jgi:hypothetical protein
LNPILLFFRGCRSKIGTQELFSGLFVVFFVLGNNFYQCIVVVVGSHLFYIVCVWLREFIGGGIWATNSGILNSSLGAGFRFAFEGFIGVCE